MTELEVGDRGGDEPEAPAPSLITRIDADLASLDAEITEIDLLLQQARNEASRHEQRLEQAGERIAQVTSGRAVAIGEVTEAYQALVTVTRKAGVMQSSIDVLEGKRRTLVRFRDRMLELRATLEGVDLPAVGGAAATAGVSRIVLTAQEDMRREIARAMHDGPAQSLTNIVLQAQIVQRLHGRDQEATAREIDELVRMVSRTLEATKTFIFDVRPMVLDDLGLMPTLRRAARERSRRSKVPIDFDSVGADRRLPIEVESTLFRMIDEVLAGFVATRPDRISMRLDWGFRLVAVISTPYTPPAATLPAGEPVSEAEAAAGTEGIPPALAAMMRQRVVDAAPRLRDVAETALADDRWREVDQRAATIGADVSLDEAGHRVRIAIDLPT
jgi:two-component system, NarL family, sensor histidine kinase DegS